MQNVDRCLPTWSGTVGSRVTDIKYDERYAEGLDGMNALAIHDDISEALEAAALTCARKSGSLVTIKPNNCHHWIDKHQKQDASH